MNQLRIDRGDSIYKIEVNDKGETIEFDLADIELPFKLQRAYDGIQRIQNELQGKLTVLEKQKDKKTDGHLYSKLEEERLKAWRKAFRDMRAAMDAFLGENGCQKIFGDANYLEMYDDLFAELQKPQADGKSHLEHMELSGECIKERITRKYGKKTNGRVI